MGGESLQHCNLKNINCAQHDRGAEIGSTLVVNTCSNLCSVLIIVIFAGVAIVAALWMTSSLMEGYQRASLVDASKCHPEVSRKHIAHVQFQPVWAAIKDDNTKRSCHIPICSLLKGGSPDFVSTKDKCKASTYFC